MKQELRERILRYNLVLAQRREKAEDLDVLVTAMFHLPTGQLKKLLTEDVRKVLCKYGYTEE